jgi:hypothetical protein
VSVCTTASSLTYQHALLSQQPLGIKSIPASSVIRERNSPPTITWETKMVETHSALPRHVQGKSHRLHVLSHHIPLFWDLYGMSGPLELPQDAELSCSQWPLGIQRTLVSYDYSMVPKIINLKAGNVYMIHSFRGFSPWSPSPVAMGLVAPI